MFRILLAMTLLISAISIWTPREASAQHISFGFGHHGHHDDWHHGWYDHWAPPPHVVYVNPPPPRTVYVVPQNSTAQYNTQPNAVAAPRPSVTTTVAAPRKNSIKPATRVTIRNACGKGVPVAFLIDGRDIELQDGATQVFTAAGSRVIEFDRGDQYGSARYELESGTYQFAISDNGWQLLRDNMVSPQDSTATGIKKNSLPVNR